MTARLRFRNVHASPDDPVASWPLEAVRTALERGQLGDLRRVAEAIRREPWGRVARQVEEVLAGERPYGVADSMSLIIDRERRAAAVAERAEVAAELRRLLAQSGLSGKQFASLLGTSASRLSTYLSGSVTPSAAVLVRARKISR